MRSSALALGISAALAAVAVTGCGSWFGGHEVGDCVRTRISLGGTDITSADCPTGSSSTFDTKSITDPVYKVASVLDIDAHCPPSGTGGGIELQHEPDDVVYCLVPAKG
jgi:hypothetical protein